MSIARKICTIALSMALCCVAAFAARVGINDSEVLYRQYSGLETDSIYRMGVRLSHDETKLDSAVVCLNFLLFRSEARGFPKEDRNVLIQSHNLLGYLYLFEYGDYAKSHYHLWQAKELSERYDIEDYKHSINTNLGALYRIIGALSGSDELKHRGLECLKDNFHSALEAGHWRPAVSSLLNIGSIALHEDSIALISEELQAFNNAEIPDQTPRLSLARHFAEALQAYDGGDYAKAEHCLNQMESLIDDDAESARTLLMVLTNKYVVLRAARDYDSMEQCLDQAQEVAQQTEASDVLATIYREYQDLYELRGDKYLAQQYELRYYRQADSIEKMGEANKVETMETQYLLDSVTRDIKNLTDKAERDRIVLIFSVVLLALSLIFGLYAWFSYKRERQTHRMLYQTNLQLLESINEQSKVRRKYAASTLSDDDKSDLSEKIREVLESSPEIYSEGFTVERLAQLVNSKPRNVSQVLNEVWGRSFPQVLSEERVHEACRRINDIENNGKFTIESIGEDVGFRSRTHFIATFKKVTGLTPSQYRKNRMEMENEAV